MASGRERRGAGEGSRSGEMDGRTGVCGWVFAVGGCLTLGCVCLRNGGGMLERLVCVCSPRVYSVVCECVCVCESGGTSCVVLE